MSESELRAAYEKAMVDVHLGCLMEPLQSEEAIDAYVHYLLNQRDQLSNLCATRVSGEMYERALRSASEAYADRAAHGRAAWEAYKRLNSDPYEEYVSYDDWAKSEQQREGK